MPSSNPSTLLRGHHAGQGSAIVEELNLDQDCLGIDAVRGEVIKRSAKFIDIGIPSSLLEAQKLIPMML